MSPFNLSFFPFPLSLIAVSFNSHSFITRKYASTHTHARARARTHTHARTHTQYSIYVFLGCNVYACSVTTFQSRWGDPSASLAPERWMLNFSACWNKVGIFWGSLDDASPTSDIGSTHHPTVSTYENSICLFALTIRDEEDRTYWFYGRNVRRVYVLLFLEGISLTGLPCMYTLVYFDVGM